MALLDLIVTFSAFTLAGSVALMLLPDGSVRPCPADTVSVGIEVCYRLHGDAGAMWIFSSCPAESLIAAVPKKAKKNMQMKECGKAHLGSPALMLREDGYYSEE